MFTGIIESVGKIVKRENHQSNVVFHIESSLAPQLKIDQSVAHDGVCLTVTGIYGNIYTVTAIEETLRRTNLASWRPEKLINLERAMMAGARLDGHMVQGHVDTIATCTRVQSMEGSWIFTFELDSDDHNKLMVEKGSICLNGISLTLLVPEKNRFSVAIIPYTYEHTNIHQIQAGDTINVEFDILGKYIQKHIANYLGANI
jgi:riboflavin synthase